MNRKLLLIMLLAGMRPVAAQDSAKVAPYPWRTTYFPYLTASPNDGVMGLWRFVYFRQARFEDRVSLRDAIAVEGGYSTHNSWVINARGDFPRIADNWRVETDAQLSHTPRFGNPDHPQVRTAQNVNVEITRRIAGPFAIAARAGMEHVDNLDSESLNIKQTDRRARIALVLDLRDREFDTKSGALIEAGVFTGHAVDSYHGSYGLVRGWMSPSPTTLATARVGFRSVSRTASIGIQEEIPAWEHTITTFGGPQSQRGLGLGEVQGRGLLLGGAEVRQQLRQFVKGLVSITAIAFVDGGRAFQDPSPLVDPIPGSEIPSGDLKFTFKDWKWSVGGGVALKLLKDARLTLTAAHGDDHVRWYLSSGWAW